MFKELCVCPSKFVKEYYGARNAFNENDQLIVSIETVENYLKLIEQNKSNDYFKKLHAIVEDKPPIYKKKDGQSSSSKARDKLEKVEGEGINEDKNIIFLSNNPCELFYQLSKLLSAKKAGHNNIYNQVNAICKRLMELDLMTSEKYRNILKIYF